VNRDYGRHDLLGQPADTVGKALIIMNDVVILSVFLQV